MGTPPPIAVRVVIDTNCLISALLFGGHLDWLRQAWQARRIVPLFSNPTALEIVRVLAYPKFKLTSAEREAVLAEILPFAEAIDLPARLPPVPKLRDADDLPFLELALVAKAEALVTGDRDLLALGPQFSVPIVTPAELQELLGREWSE